MSDNNQNGQQKQMRTDPLQQLVECLVDCAFHHACSTHRGALATNGMTFVFGNGGYDDCPESQRGVELLREALTAEEIQEVAFATDTEDGSSWGMLLEGDHEDWLNDNMWSFADEACSEAGSEK